ncbi:MAG TPA: S41 family peptidase [Bdellovibrionota bacterium]|nr:S41 family peptidase [Bdellovibrionota bacterium]
MSFAHVLAGLLAAFPIAQALAADPVPPYATLGSRRALIAVPVYTPAEKKTVVDQATLLLKDLFVHREKKISLHGPAVDPLPLLERLSAEAERLPETDLHARLEHIFTLQRDLHTNYYFPVPYSCHRSMLPFSLALATDVAGREALAVRSLVTVPEVLALSPGIERVRVGDVVVSYDGIDPIEAARKLLQVGCGANDAAGLRRGIQNLTLRSQRLHALPALDTVKLVLKSRTGVTYSLELPWIARADQACLNPPTERSPQPAFERLNRAEDEYQLEYERLYKPQRPRSRLHALTTEPTAEPIVSWKVLNNEYGTFGYLRLDSFSPVKLGDNGTIELVRGLLGKELRATDGLVIDLRDNGGGSIRFSESLIQLFTPGNVTPQGFRLLNSRTNHLLARRAGGVFAEALERADMTGAAYTDGETLSSPEVTNGLGQSYFKPVAVLTNSGCYSACDMFTALFQDHGVGPVFGEDAATGGGGANVVAQSEFLSMSEGATGPFVKLPGRQDMRVAWRQTIRSGLHAGVLLEDEGVAADRLAPLSLADFYSQDSQQIRAISAELGRSSARHVSSARLDSDARVDLAIGSPIRFGAELAGTTAVEFRAGGRSLGFERLNVGDAPVHADMTVPGLVAGALGNVGTVELRGFLAGSRVWRKVVSYRVVPPFQALGAAGAVALEFDGGPIAPLSTFVTGGDESSGWVVREGRLHTGKGPEYGDNLMMEASLFVDLAGKTSAALSFDAAIRTEKDYDFFSVVVVENGKAEQVLKPVSGEIPLQPYQLDLSAHAGKKVEIRFLFESDAGVTAPGVSIDHLTLK